MFGFCKKRHREKLDITKYCPKEPTTDDRQGIRWVLPETTGNNQGVLQYTRLSTFSVEFGPCLILMQGYCHPARLATAESNERFLLEILREYRESGRFEIPSAEGSFTISFLDGQNGKTFLYRNLVGSTLTYYTLTENGFFWGTNFAQFVRTSQQAKAIDESMLPVLFLGRYPTGNRTLLGNVFRLQPGELVTFDGDAMHVEQVTTFRDFEEPRKTNETESIERVEAVTQEIMRDWGSLWPNTANLLSGGVDSTYLQVHWNAWWRQSPTSQGDKPLSSVVWLNHPMTRADLQYAQSAVEATGSHNIAVEQPLPTPEFLAEIIGRNGEFPNHVQSLYFDTLAREMRQAGVAAGIIGEGADGLFGTGVQDAVRAAQSWKETLVSPWLIKTTTFAARLLGGHFTANAVEASQWIDDVHNPLHPVNQAAVFTDRKTLRSCFAPTDIQGAVDYKLGLLETLKVPRDPLNLQLSLTAGYAWEAAVTASYWTQLFAENGLAMCSPFLDSRMIRATLNIAPEAHFVPGNPKQVLKNALLRHVPSKVVNRPKLGFGQPIFEWLASGGILHERVEAIRTFDWFDQTVKRELLQKPNWILWTMLCFDIWHDTVFE